MLYNRKTSTLEYAMHISVSPFKKQVYILRPMKRSLQTKITTQNQTDIALRLIKMFYN